MIKSIKKALALLLSVTITINTTDFNLYAAEIGGTVPRESSEAVTENGDTGITPVEQTQEPVQKDLESVYEADNFRVVFSLTDEWDNGYNVLVKIENTGDTVIQNWYLEYDAYYEITNLWNAEIYESTKEKSTIKNAGWNQDIAVGESVEFGFTASGVFGGFPTAYRMPEESTEVKSEEYLIEYHTENDWGSGYTGKITITSNTEKELEDWILEFDFDRNISSIWNGIIESHTDNHYVIRNSGYNANIRPGQTVSVGFNGDGGKREDTPGGYKLYSYRADSKYIELPDGKIEKEYLYKKIYPYLMQKGISIENIRLSDDFDSDGLNLEQEFMYDTNPFSGDTDDDGLSDYDEINRYETNPLKWDTDEDGMGDGTEIKSGLNPLDRDSDGNGVHDGEETVTQSVTFDNTCRKQLEDTDNLPVVQITGKGDYSTKLTVRKVENDAAVLDIDAVVGTPYDFVHEEELKFEKGELTFKVKGKILQEHKLEDLAIAYYNDDTNVLELLKSTYNREEKTVSAEVTHFSRYMLVSVPDYFFNIDSGNESSIIESGKADVVFAVDTTGSMYDSIQNVKNNIGQFVSELDKNKVDIRLGLIEFKDIYADGKSSTKSHGWYRDVSSFQKELAALSVSGGGGDGPETSVDALDCAGKMKYRTGVKKYIILLTDDIYHNGTSADTWFTMDDETDALVQEEFVVSVVTRTRCYPWYEQLVSRTDGVMADIFENFADSITPLVLKMKDQVNSGCWIRLSNGSVVCLDKDPRLEDADTDTDGDGIPDAEELGDSYQVQAYNPYTHKVQFIDTWRFSSDPSKKDTDGDGIDDAKDLRPAQFDVTISSADDYVILFNTGRQWQINSHTAEEIWNAHKTLRESEYDLNRNSSSAKHLLEEAAVTINENDLQSFTRDELIMISLLDGDGIRFYLDSRPVLERETLFQGVYGRKTGYYQQKGIVNRTWKSVSGYGENGFFKGKVLSEADIVYSFESLRMHDIYEVIDLAEILGLIVVSSLVVAEVGIFVAVNITALSGYVQEYGVRAGVNFYLALGAAGSPAYESSLMKTLGMELLDGDDREFRLVEYADEIIKVEESIWTNSDIERGNYLDHLCGNNLGHNFPVIDKLEDRVITSIKSFNPELKSYERAKDIFNKMVRDAEALSKFKGKRWGEYNITFDKYDSKVLQFVLPDTTVNTEQMLGIQAAKTYIEQFYDMKVIITITTAN